MNSLLIDKIFIKEVQDVVLKAGEILLSFLDKKHDYFYKNDGSFATEADLASESFLIKNLKRILPEASFLAEESCNKMDEVESLWRWIIDPLDGTTNFSHGFPYFAVSVALAYKEKPVLGFVYNPNTKEMFFAAEGLGAFLNGKKIRVGNRVEIEKSLVSLVIPCVNKDCLYFQQTVKVLQDTVCSSIRKLGAASLDLAYVAAGKLDASVLKYVYWWDIAAGMVLVQEAGGIICEFDKKVIKSNFSSCLATNVDLVDKFRNLLD